MDVLEGGHEADVEYGQRGERNDQHEDRVEDIAVDDQVEPVVDQRSVNGTEHALAAVLQS